MMAFSQAGSAAGLTASPTPVINAASAIHSPTIADPAIHPDERDRQRDRDRERLRRKRKADSQDTNNDRLNKRMSLLNLEHNGAKLYVPVEQSHLPSPQTLLPLGVQPFTTTANIDTNATVNPIPEQQQQPQQPQQQQQEPMHLDDTKHKVYIYNLDDELSDDDDDSSEFASPREGRLVFLPDIEKHLRANRIPVPRPILPNRDGELAGMQMVLYQPDGPKSISVPEEHDSVRRAIVAARERLREKQALERSGGGAAGVGAPSAVKGHVNGTRKGMVSFATPVKFPPPVAREREEEGGSMSMMLDDQAVGQSSFSATAFGNESDSGNAGYDPDAMDID